MKLSRACREVRDDRGSVAPITAILLLSLFGFGALVVDLGSFQLARRQLQAATDAAALSATYAFGVTDVRATEGLKSSSAPSDWVTAYLSNNGFPNATVTTDAGTYCPEAGLSAHARFTVAATGCPGFADLGVGPNAVRVTTTQQAPTILSRVFSPRQTAVTVGATATAAQIPQAGFYAGSGLLEVDGGLMNAVLAQLLGANLKLTAIQYQGMLNANFSAFRFFNALATNIGLSAGTYGGLLQSRVTVQQVLQAEASALNAPNSDASIGLNELAASVPGNPTVLVGSLFDLGVWQSLGIGSSNPPPALTASVNAYQLASLTAQIANGQHALTMPASSLGIPGVATLGLTATMIEPPVTAPFVFGPVGMTVHTAQIRLQLQLQLLKRLNVGGLITKAPVTLPVYVEIASADATLTKIACGDSPGTDTQVTVNATPAAAKVFIGTVADTVMSDFTKPVVPSAATILDTTVSNAPVTGLGLNIPALNALLDLVTVTGDIKMTGSAEIALGSSEPTDLTFSQADIAGLTAQTVTSTGMMSHLLSTLVSTLKIQPQSALIVGGIGLSAGLTQTLVSSVGSIVSGAVNSALQPVAAGLDPLADGMLAALGIKVGYVDVTVTGVRCGSPVLVN